MPNPSINNVYDEKKILGCCVEKYGANQVALAAKMYTIWSDDRTISLKVKGVSIKKNIKILHHNINKSGKSNK